ncbi:MAG TPA: transposase [Woeseiaceae bacterium]|nr:transposase [Woeseiaceae bacterium]
MPASLLEPTGTRKLRRARCSQRNQIYHLTAATQGRKRVFTDLAAGRTIVQSLRHEAEIGRCETLCFVLMPDHLHWLMQLKTGESISRIVNDVKGHSARRLNQILAQRGRIWQKGFHDHAMRTDEDVVATARYIIANPVRAGLVARVGDYPLWDAVWV